MQFAWLCTSPTINLHNNWHSIKNSSHFTLNQVKMYVHNVTCNSSNSWHNILLCHKPYMQSCLIFFSLYILLQLHKMVYVRKVSCYCNYKMNLIFFFGYKYCLPSLGLSKSIILYIIIYTVHSWCYYIWHIVYRIKKYTKIN